MVIWKLMQGLMVATVFCWGPLVVAQQPEVRVEINSLSETGKQSPLMTQSLAAGGSITVVAQPTRVQTFSTSGRYLVRLKDQPLQPFIRQFKPQMVVSGSNGARVQLLSASLQQKQRIETAQSQLINTALNRKLVTKVHHQFHELTNTLSVTLAPDALEAVRQLPQVAAIYPDGEVRASLTNSVPTTHAPEVWAMQDAHGNAITGKGVKVAILDTGIDYTQPDLGGCVGTGCKVVAGQSFVTGTASTDFMDRHGHGTHVAGIVAASGTLKGMAPDASLYAYKVLNDQGYGLDSNIIAALETAVNPDGDPATDDGVDVVNMSLGGYGLPDSPLTEAANAAMGAGTLVVVAAGNSGSNYGTIGSPGNGERVLTVGAVNNQDAIAYFSSRGPVAGKNYVKPEIVAPGVDINSVKAGGGYVAYSGTSMATPHVAGGAALVLQARPGLSPDDLKSLLISSARDLGKDVFSQGAGAMDVLAAVQADVLVTAPLQYLGFVDTTVPFWNAPATLSVKNLSNAAVNLSLDGPASPLAGMNINLPVGYQKILAAGEQTDIDYAVMVDNDLLPFSTRASFHHENAFALVAGQRSLRIPVALVKAAQLIVNSGGNLNYLMLISVDNSTSEFKYVGCAPDITSQTFNLRPGKYHLVASYCGAENPFVFKENLEITGTQTLAVDVSEASLKIGVDKLITADGTSLTGAALTSKITPISWHHAEAKTAVYTNYTGSGSVLMRLNPVSSAFKIRGAMLLQDRTNQPATTTYHHNFVFDEGVSSDQLVTLNAADMSKVDFSYKDSPMVDKGVAFSYRLSENRSLGQWYAFGFGLLSNIAQYTPVQATLYATPSVFKDGEWYPEMDVGRIVTDPYGYADNQSIMHSGFLAFPSKDQYLKLPGLFFDWQNPAFVSDSKLIEVRENGYFNNTSFIYNFASKTLFLLNPRNWSSNAAELRDEQDNFFNEQAAGYTALCDDTPVATGKVSDSDFYSRMAGQTCDKVSYEVSYPVRFLGKENTSLMRVLLNTHNDGNNYQLSSPALEQLRFSNGDKLGRILNGEDPRITLVARNSVTGIQPPLEQISLQYKLDDGDWSPLALEVSGEKLLAKLPVLAGEHLGSLRLSISDGKGSSVEHALNGIFVLGTGAKRPTSPPEFGVLPRLVKEATSALTPYEFPPVYALDEDDGKILATTQNLGPFPLGANQIIWTVVNKANVTASTSQMLIIVDTTPPLVLAPPTIEMTATGTYTAVNLGAGQAFDVVDGVFDAIPDQVGPFPVGTRTVVWTGTDKSGNQGSATQTVVINAMPSSSSSSSVASSSSSSLSSSSSTSSVSAASSTATVGGSGSTGKSGGGGAVDMLMLFWLALGVFGWRERLQLSH